MKCPVPRNAETTAPAGLPADFNHLTASVLSMIPDCSLALVETAKEPAAARDLKRLVPGARKTTIDPDR